PWTRWQNWLAALVGIWVFISPWVLGTTTSAAAAWNAWIIGAAIVIVALAVLATSGYLAEWISVALGIWLFISPWVLGYTGIRDGSWSAWIFGVVSVILALWALPRRHGVGQTVRPADRLDAR
ncbi:MAG TPA: SPW repeat protein, partial [Streptosporangiaceae bacterium]